MFVHILVYNNANNAGGVTSLITIVTLRNAFSSSNNSWNIRYTLLLKWRHLFNLQSGEFPLCYTCTCSTPYLCTVYSCNIQVALTSFDKFTGEI